MHGLMLMVTYARMLVAVLAHLNLFNPAAPLSSAISRPHSPASLKPARLPASALPISLPYTYPAEKLMALNRTTTLALTTHIINVGLTSSKLVGVVEATLRIFLAALRSLLLLRGLDAVDVEVAVALRLPLSTTAGEPRLLDGTTPVETASDAPIAMDSGTMRNVLVSMRFEFGDRCCVSCLVDFGTRRAAAAHESRVERLARSAAS